MQGNESLSFKMLKDWNQKLWLESSSHLTRTQSRKFLSPFLFSIFQREYPTRTDVSTTHIFHFSTTRKSTVFLSNFKPLLRHQTTSYIIQIRGNTTNGNKECPHTFALWLANDNRHHCLHTLMYSRHLSQAEREFTCAVSVTRAHSTFQERKLKIAHLMRRNMYQHNLKKRKNPNAHQNCLLIQLSNIKTMHIRWEYFVKWNGSVWRQGIFYFTLTLDEWEALLPSSELTNLHVFLL